ncbi:aspartic peptidase domain-containing protein [Suillus spraguei]|nr:aspartic peptidase domain-containing protein [Suillus spraguei]
MGLPIVEVCNPFITLPLTRRLNFSNSTINFLQCDEARLHFFDYRVQVGIGEPPTTYNLLVNTGSSIIWVGTSTPYKRTSTSVMSEWHIKVDYSAVDTDPQSFFSGPMFYNTITLSGGLTITWFQLGVASSWWGFHEGEDGIFGIGPKELSHGAIENDQDGMILSFTDYLYIQGKIGQQVVDIFFQPITREPDSEFGELTFARPIIAMPPSLHYWGINQRITYSQTPILGFIAGIVNTGTTFLYLASNAFAKYEAATSATWDQTTCLLHISPDQCNALWNLNFYIGHECQFCQPFHPLIFSLTPDAQIWPHSLNTKLIGDTGTRSGQGFDFIIGYTFMQHFYTLFDSSSSLISFARTPFTYATTNLLL